MRIIVTGGAGFIGSNLSAALLEQGHDVIIVDDLSTGRAANIPDGAKLIEHDVTDPLAIEGGVDLIYHLACPASPPKYQRDPVRTLLTSVLGTKHALDLVKEKGARILFTSTSEVYGDPERHPQPEEYRGNVNSIGPRACYDEGKRAAEALCYDHARMHGTDVRVARIFNTYGPRMDPEDGRVVSTFIVQALAGRPLTVFGDGSQTRSFCYVADMVRGLMTLMASEEMRPVNLGNPDERSVLEIAKLVLELTGSSSEIVHAPLPEDDPRRRCPDITRAAALGWEPRTGLEDGLRETIAYFKE